MNKEAFFEGYTKKDLLPNPLNGYVNKKKLNDIINNLLTNPAMRILTYLPEILGVGGAGLGAMIGHKLSKGPYDSKREKERPEFGSIFTGALLGGSAGAFTGRALKNRVKWDKLREAMKQL